MNRIFKNWRKLIKENWFGSQAMPSGKLSNPCPQGEEQNGFHPDGTPYCRAKPKVKEKKKLFKKAKIQPYNFDWGLIDENDREIVPTREKIKNKIFDNPDRVMKIDYEPGETKKFGGKKEIPLTFYYGEWSNLINPADNMGWDFIIVPSATPDDENLIPVGYVAYNENKPSAMFNDKIIIAPDGKYDPEDRKLIKSVFDQMDYFDNPVWY